MERKVSYFIGLILISQAGKSFCREFTIANDRFIKDGEELQIISGRFVVDLGPHQALDSSVSQTLTVLRPSLLMQPALSPYPSRLLGRSPAAREKSGIQHYRGRPECMLVAEQSAETPRSTAPMGVRLLVKADRQLLLADC